MSSSTPSINAFLLKKDGTTSDGYPVDVFTGRSLKDSHGVWKTANPTSGQIFYHENQEVFAFVHSFLNSIDFFGN